MLRAEGGLKETNGFNIVSNTSGINIWYEEPSHKHCYLQIQVQSGLYPNTQHPQPPPLSPCTMTKYLLGY